MKSRTTREFRELFGALSKNAQRQARRAYRMFRDNPSHPGLRFKRVHDTPPIYSARVGIHHRALAIVDESSAIWYWIGAHAEYDEVLKHF